MVAKVLVVDDEESWLELVRDRLSELGHEVVTTPDCTDALVQISADRPDLVIIDLRMPVSGSTMLRELRQDWPDLPVVVHTAYSGYRHSPNLRGITGFAVKAPDLAELVGAVENVLAKRRVAPASA